MTATAETLTDHLGAPLESDRFEPSGRSLELTPWFVLDTISVGLAGSVLEHAFVAAFAAAAAPTPGDSTVLVTGDRVDAAVAASVNAASVHTIDFDDSYLSGVKAHLSASIVPTAIAVAEETQRSGRDCLEAIIRGFEVAARLGHAVVPSHLGRWHPTGTLGVVGAAAAAAWLYELPPEACAMALGLAGDRAAGTRFCLTSGDATKALHAAFAAHDGIVSARLARAGVAGPRGFFDGEHGYVATYSDLADAVPAAGGLGRPAIEDNCTKFMPCMHGLQAAAAAAIAIGRARPVSAPEDVERILVRQTTGRAHMGRNWDPETALAARLSLPYVVAAALLHRELGLDQFRPEQLNDPVQRGVMERIAVEGSAQLQETFGSRVVSEVEVTFADGAVVREDFADPVGTPQRPADEGLRAEKFRRLAGMRLRQDAVDAVIDLGLGLERAPDVRGLTRAVVEGHA